MTLDKRRERIWYDTVRLTPSQLKNRILKHHYIYPKITRGEIVDMIDAITSGELDDGAVMSESDTILMMNVIQDACCFSSRSPWSYQYVYDWNVIRRRILYLDVSPCCDTKPAFHIYTNPSGWRRMMMFGI